MKISPAENQYFSGFREEHVFAIFVYFSFQKNDLSQKWLLITASLGITFLICQLFEYFNLPFGLTDNLFASTFYALTGFHGLHVTLGTLMILIISWQTRINGGRITYKNMFPLEAVELYWHFVDGIWVILFIILYLYW